MDEIFGSTNLVSVVTFQKTGGQSSELLSSVSDYLIWFAKNVNLISIDNRIRKRSWGWATGPALVTINSMSKVGRFNLLV